MSTADRAHRAPEQPGYWYPDEQDVIAMLHALRRFRRSDQSMRRRMSAGMDMNESDMQALQLVMEAESKGEQLTPRELSRHLGISSASTTKLVDRLTASGHLARTPHPTDRRSVFLSTTEHAHEEIRSRLTWMHERMAEIARGVPPEQRPGVVKFLTDMSDELDSQGVIAPLTPHTP